jgi:hypothetical protein
MSHNGMMPAMSYSNLIHESIVIFEILVVILANFIFKKFNSNHAIGIGVQI